MQTFLRQPVQQAKPQLKFRVRKIKASEREIKQRRGNKLDKERKRKAEALRDLHLTLCCHTSRCWCTSSWIWCVYVCVCVEVHEAYLNRSLSWSRRHPQGSSLLSLCHPGTGHPSETKSCPPVLSAKQQRMCHVWRNTLTCTSLQLPCVHTMVRHHKQMTTLERWKREELPVKPPSFGYAVYIHI